MLKRNVQQLDSPTSAQGSAKRRRNVNTKLDFTTVQITPPRSNPKGLRLSPAPTYASLNAPIDSSYFNVKLPTRVNLTVSSPEDTGGTQSVQAKNQPKKPSSSTSLFGKSETFKGKSKGSYLNGDITVPANIWLPSDLTEDHDITLEGLSLTAMKSLKIFNEKELEKIVAFSGPNFDSFKTESVEYQEFFKETFKEFNIDPNSMIDFYSPPSTGGEYLSL